MIERRNWLSRKEASAYLTERGVKISARTLANLASNNNAGKGPPYTQARWRTVLYARADLDTWLAREMRRVE